MLKLGLAVGLALPALAMAEQAVRLDRIEVVAPSRVEESLAEVPASVSVIERDAIFESLGFDLRSLLRYEPGVSVEGNPARFGLGNVAIRGLEGNRVQMTLDGIRLPESYRVGSFSNASRNALGLGLVRRVELVRGPASAVHGSDALAGVLAFTTVEPSDYLRGGMRFGGETFAAFAEADEGAGGGAVIAGASGNVRWLAGFERRDGHEAANRGEVGGTGASRTQPNPQDTSAESQLAKGSVLLPGGWTVGATLDRFARSVRTDVLSLNPQSSRTVSLTGDDRAVRTRASAEAQGFDVGPFGRLKLTAYVQRAETTQDTDEIRANTTAVCLSAPGTISCEREARFRFVQRESGVIAIGESRRGPHHVVSGAEFSRIDADERREGRQTNLSTGAVTNVVGGETLPTRDFPATRTDRLGVFVQDRIGTTALSWIPGLRYDRFRIGPSADELFRVNRPVVGLHEDAWSPRLGLVWRVSDRWTVTGQIATGFRAPPAADLNIGLSNLPAGYAVVANPDLRPETSRGAEAGIRFSSIALDASANLFHTRYNDLIVSRAALACPADPHCVPGATGTFQSQNISSARIHGFEARARWRIAPEWSMNAAYANLRGDDLGKGAPLNSVDPPRLVAGLEWQRADLRLAVHATRTSKVTRVDPSSGVRFVPPAWTTLDVTARWRIRSAIALDAGVFNALDRKYWLWSEVRGLTNITSGFDRYTQPGRNFGLALRATF